MDPLVLTIRETAALLRLSESKVASMVRAGQIEVCRFGTRRLIPVAGLTRLIEAMRQNGGDLPEATS